MRRDPVRVQLPHVTRQSVRDNRLSVVESLVGHNSPAMTRHYTHTGEAAAIDAVNGLPMVIGEAPKPLPASARTVDAETVRKLAEGMTPKTWRTLRAELLSLVSVQPH